MIVRRIRPRVGPDAQLSDDPVELFVGERFTTDLHARLWALPLTRFKNIHRRTHVWGVLWYGVNVIR